MKRMMRIAGLLFMLLLFFAQIIHAQSVSEYLILQDIGGFIFKTQTKDFITGQLKAIPGYSARSGSGVLAGARHFGIDHKDTTYMTTYVNRAEKMAVEVQVTQHAGSDSDKWLLHEIEDGYRDGDNDEGRLGLLSGAGVKIRVIDGNRIIYWGLGGGSYTWISKGNVVVEIKYVDLQRVKPEPLEVVKAYLAKHPSSLTLTDTELKSTAHVTSHNILSFKAAFFL